MDRVVDPGGLIDPCVVRNGAIQRAINARHQRRSGCRAGRSATANATPSKRTLTVVFAALAVSGWIERQIG